MRVSFSCVPVFMQEWLLDAAVEGQQLEAALQGQQLETAVVAAQAAGDVAGLVEALVDRALYHLHLGRHSLAKEDCSMALALAPRCLRCSAVQRLIPPC